MEAVWALQERNARRPNHVLGTELEHLSGKEYQYANSGKERGSYLTYLNWST
jgi:hypothetical protein